VLVRLFAVTKYLKKQVKNILEWGRGGREGTVSEVSVHPGREDVVEKRSSPYGN
jgi:hypothetical protein